MRGGGDGKEQGKWNARGLSVNEVIVESLGEVIVGEI